MNMMAKPMAGPGLAADVISDFIETGAHVFHSPVDASAAGELLSAIKATRAFDHTLFLSEAEFDADPLYTGVNPRPGRNLLERFEDQLDFVERAPHIVEAVTALLGEDYEILNKKVVCEIGRAHV